MLKKILNTTTFRQSLLVIPSTLVNGLLGLFFYVLTARVLGAREFGLLSVTIAVLSLIVSIVDVGTDTGIIRFVGKHINSDRQKALQFLKLAFKTKLIVWMVTFFVGWFLVPSVAEHVFNKDELVTPLRIALFGVGGGLLFSFVTSSLQAIQRFTSWSILNISTNAARLIIIGFFAIISLANLDSVLWVYILLPFIGFLVGFLFLPKFIDVNEDSGTVKQFFHYNKWIALFTIVAALSSRLDTFLTTRFLTLEQVGIYSVAVVLASIVVQIVSAIATIAAPKLAGFSNKRQAIDYLRKLQYFVSFLAIVLVLVGIPLSMFFIPIFYGANYSFAIQPFIILLIAQSVFLISIPVHISIMYYFSYPKLFVWLGLLHICAISLLGVWLIPNLGVIGAAISILIGNILNFVLPALWVMRKFRK